MDTNSLKRVDATLFTALSHLYKCKLQTFCFHGPTPDGLEELARLTRLRCLTGLEHLVVLSLSAPLLLLHHTAPM